jgi:hypothetical protein
MCACVIYVYGFSHLTVYSSLITVSPYLSLRLSILNSALVGQLQDAVLL